MAFTFEITSSGTLTTMVFPEWGKRTFIHPVTSFDILPEFSFTEIINSDTFKTYLDAGHITASFNNVSITVSTQLESLSHDAQRIQGVDVKLQTPLDNEVITYDSGDDKYIPKAVGSLFTPVTYGDFYDSAGGTTSNSTTWVAIPLNNERKKDVDFSHDNITNNSEVTIATTDTYVIFGRMSVENTGSSSRSESEGRLELNTGSGWNPVSGTTGEMYARQTNFGATSTFFSALDLTSGDKLRMVFRRETGGGTIRLEADGSSLMIIKIKGSKGDTGDTGAGANVIIQEDDVTIGTVTSTINFEGPVTLTDEGSGKTTVTVDIAYPERFYTNSEGSSSTTSNSWQQKLNLSANVSGGIYELIWYYEIASSDVVDGRVRINDSTTVNNINYKPDDDNEYLGQGGFYEVVLSAGLHDFDIDYRDADSGTARIRYARLKLIKISE